MNPERVEEIIGYISAGNEDFRTVLEDIYNKGRKIINEIPEEKEEMAARKFIHVAGLLVRRRISAQDLLTLKGGYWQTEGGRATQQRVLDYVQNRLK